MALGERPWECGCPSMCLSEADQAPWVSSQPFRPLSQEMRVRLLRAGPGELEQTSGTIVSALGWGMVLKFWTVSCQGNTVYILTGCYALPCTLLPGIQGSP